MKPVAVSLAGLLSVLVIGVSGCGGNDDESGSTTTGTTTGESGSAGQDFVDGACTKGSQTAAVRFEVVDCDSPEATGTLREVDSIQDCPGTGIQLNVVAGERVDKSFCIDRVKP